MIVPFSRLAVLLMLASGVASAETSAKELALLRAELSELHGIVLSLRETNQRLQNDLDHQAEELILVSKEAEGLAAALKECRSASGEDAVQTPAVRKAVDPPAELPATAKTGFLVDYVNAAHHYLILRAGTVDGLDVGQKGRVIRDGEVLAAIQVIHVLPQQAVADLVPDSLTSPGIYPRQGDFVLIP